MTYPKQTILTSCAWPAAVHFNLIAAGLLISTMSLCAASTSNNPDQIAAEPVAIVFHPINHATLAIQGKDVTILVDPVGPKSRFDQLPAPDYVLITDVHQDHLQADTLGALVKPGTKIVAPPAVVALLPQSMAAQIVTLSNGQSHAFPQFKVEAIPAYNLTASRMAYHAKGRGNGYVITLQNKRIYLSGDTEDIPEMKQLSQIDVAFVCMNLPYTMDETQAANAVKAFRPKIVYPYHCRGSHLDQFAKLLQDQPAIEVRLRDWYGK
jgi:L-ascorbate metabolism protein UlaG (beta-lactamase superfamily)